MKQLSLAKTGFQPKAGKQTRKAVFLSEMDRVAPWSRLEALIEAHYPRKGNARPPMPLATMLRIHFLQQWFGYSEMQQKTVCITEKQADFARFRAIVRAARQQIAGCSDFP